MTSARTAFFALALTMFLVGFGLVFATDKKDKPGMQSQQTPTSTTATSDEEESGVEEILGTIQEIEAAMITIKVKSEDGEIETFEVPLDMLIDLEPGDKIKVVKKGDEVTAIEEEE